MSEPKKRPARPRGVFHIPDGETRPLESLRGIPPQSQGAAVIMADDEKRNRCAYVIQAYTDALQMAPVGSNAELMERGTSYFRYCAERRLVPTVEGMACYCGRSLAAFNRWQNGQARGFVDGDLSTAECVELLKAMIDAVDGDLAMTGDVAGIPWIFRRKAQSGWVESQRVELVTTVDSGSAPLSPEEIARRLPDPDYTITDLSD